MHVSKTVARGARRRVRLVLSLLAAATSLILAACGGGGNGPSTGSTSAQAPATPTTTPTTTTPATTTSTTSTSPAPASTAAAGWTLPNADLSNTRNVSGPINSSTVSRLGVAWTVPIRGAGTFGNFATTPVVVDGVLYAQSLTSDVQAIDLRSGRVLWTRAYNSPDTGPNGVNVVDGTVYGGTATNAFALSARTGEQLWSRRLVRNRGEGIDMAPGVHDGSVYVSTVPGNNSAFYSGNGQAILWAMDARTGATRWKWREVPDDLWGNKKVNSGGGQWQPPAFDAQGNLYLNVANPAPYIGSKAYPGKRVYPWGSSRPGKNLYTDSVVKLDARTGKLIWYYQLIPHDVLDWDLNNAPVLTQSGGRQIVVSAGKAGIAIANDAQTGRLLWRTKLGRRNGHDNDNILAMNGQYDRLKRTPFRQWPGNLGGVESPYAVDGTTAYLAVNDLGFTVESQTASRLDNPESGTGEMVALDLATGRIRWQHKFAHSPYGAASVTNDLVFTTTFDGRVFALSTRTGDVAWQARLPAGTNSPVAINGDTVIAGAGYASGRGQRPEIVGYRLGATGAATSPSTTSSPPPSSANGGGAASATAGRAVFRTNCASCHTLADAGTNGTVGPNLDRLMPSDALVTRQVTNGGGGMPAFGGQLSRSDIANVARYVSSVANRNARSTGGGGAGTP